MAPCSWLFGKWITVPGYVRTGLKEPKFVARVGYAVEFGTVLAKMLEQAPLPEGKDKSEWHRDRYSPWEPIDGLPPFDKEVVNRLIDYHPSFSEYRQTRTKLGRGVAESIKEHVDDDWITGSIVAATDRSVVRAVAYGRLKKYLNRRADAEELDWGAEFENREPRKPAPPPERKIWWLTENEVLTRYGVGEETRKRLPPKWWEGPWTIEARRVCKTGTFIRGAGATQSYEGEYDYDPSYLAEEKTHCLVRLRYGGRDFSYRDVVVAALKEDLFNWDARETLNAIEASGKAQSEVA